jgi:excisionase family DNA binding protein
METQQQSRFLKLKEVQDLLGVSRTTLWRWQAEHGLKVVRVGDVVRVRESDLQVFLKRHETVNVSDQPEEIKNRGLTPQAACGIEKEK